MKANEAPEKIWMTDELVRQFDDKDFIGEDSVEYIRTDVVVEKASRWIEENIKKWYENIKVHGFKGMTPLMIIELKKYMKGE